MELIGGMGRERLLEALRTYGPMTSKDAAQRACISWREARHVLKSLHQGEQKVYVSKWKRDGSRGRWMPVYSIGARRDATRPRPLTAAQKAERYRDKISRYWCIRPDGTALRPDPIAAAMFPWMYTQTPRRQYETSTNA